METRGHMALPPNARLEALYKKLLRVRSKTDLTLPKTKHLRETFIDQGGTERALKVRYYQVQMAIHLAAMKRFVVGDDTGLGKCVTGETLVETTQGLIPIRDLCPTGMEPGTFKPASSESPRVRVGTGGHTARIRAFYYGGQKPTRRIQSRYGFEVEGSLVHPLYVRGPGGEEFWQTQYLKRGDFLCIDRGNGIFPTREPSLKIPKVAGNAKVFAVPEEMNPELARLLGYIEAEAWVNHRYQFIISQCPEKNPDTWKDIQRLLTQQLSQDIRKVEKDTCINSIFLRQYLEGMGIGYNLSADKKRVPDPILRATKESVREFLRGLFEGDGGAVNTGGVEYTTASQQLAQEVQILLLRFGVVANRSPKQVKGYSQTYWKLTIDARCFQTEIGFVSLRKQERLQEVLPDISNPNHDVIPFAKGLVEDLRAEIYERAGLHGFRGKGISTRWGSAFYNTLGHVRRGARNPTYAFLGKMLEIAAEVGVPSDHPAVISVRGVVQRNFFYDPVESSLGGLSEVFDIEVDDPEHSFIANGLVNHNTLEIIAALCVIWDKKPETPALILTTKSSAPQWVDEFNKFTEGVSAFLYEGNPKKRGEVWGKYEAAPHPKVLVMNYRKAWQDFSRFQDYGGYVLITDEATAYKNPTSQTHQVVCHLANNSARVWAATATLIKNHLLEGYSIFRVVVPGLFDNRITEFMKTFCIVDYVMLGGGRRVPKVVGYLPERIDKFRETIDPYYLGRPKHDVAEELPVLVQKVIEVPMSSTQDKKYTEIMAGNVTINVNNEEEEEEKEVSKLTALIYYQQTVNHLNLLGCEGSSGKLDALIDLLTGDFEDQNVIIFSRFKSMVDILVPTIEKALRSGKKDKTKRVVRVTGDENARKRNDAKKEFQDPRSPVRVICITSAGGEAINLQSAKAIVFFDTPWSAGEFLQVLGRMIRIGSIHDRCYAIHLCARRHESKRAWKTIDHQVLEVLDKKMVLVEAVLGQRLKGEQDSGDEIHIIEALPEITEIYNGMQDLAREEAGLKPLQRKSAAKAPGPDLSSAFCDDDEDLDALFED